MHGRGGVTSPRQRTEATCRVAPGGPGTESYPPAVRQMRTAGPRGGRAAPGGAEDPGLVSGPPAILPARPFGRTLLNQERLCCGHDMASRNGYVAVMTWLRGGREPRQDQFQRLHDRLDGIESLLEGLRLGVASHGDRLAGVGDRIDKLTSATAAAVQGVSDQILHLDLTPKTQGPPSPAPSPGKSPASPGPARSSTAGRTAPARPSG